MLKKKYTKTKLEEIINPLGLTPLKVKKLKADLEWGFRFLKTWDESESFLKKLKKLNPNLNLRNDVEKLSKIFRNSIYYSIEKNDTMWDIVWNSNPENVMRFAKSWFFNNVQIYWKADLDVADPYIKVIDENIIWIQIALKNDNTNLIANEVCAIIKNADSWLTEDFEQESYYYEINDRLNDIKIILIDHFGIEIIEFVKKLLSEAKQRRRNITQMSFSEDIINDLFKQERILDDAIAFEKSINRQLNDVEITERIAIVESAKNAILESDSFDARNPIYAGLIQTADLIINDLTINKAKKRNLDLQAILERERMIRIPRFDFKIKEPNKIFKRKIKKIISKEARLN